MSEERVAWQEAEKPFLNLMAIAESLRGWSRQINSSIQFSRLKELAILTGYRLSSPSFARATNCFQCIERPSLINPKTVQP